MWNATARLAGRITTSIRYANRQRCGKPDLCHFVWFYDAFYAIRHFFMLYVPFIWLSAMKTVLLQSNYKHKKWKQLLHYYLQLVLCRHLKWRPRELPNKRIGRLPDDRWSTILSISMFTTMWFTMQGISDFRHPTPWPWRLPMASASLPTRSAPSSLRVWWFACRA